MNRKGFNNTLKNYDGHLLEVFMIAGFVGSGFTTFKGAYEIFNHNTLVALFLTSFFQGLMYVIGRYLVRSRDRERRRTLLLWLAWGALTAFSIYASSLAMFELQHASIKRDHARASVISQWNEIGKVIIDFKTKAMTEINQARQTVNLELASERSRIRAARANHRPYSTEPLQKLSSDLAMLNSADSKLQQIKPLGIALPNKVEDAQRALGESLASLSETYAVLPEEARARVSVPRLPEAPQFPEHIQKAFWVELLSGSAPALLMLFFASSLDLPPPLVRFASSPKRTLAERVLGLRRSKRDLINAFRAPLVADIESVKITVEGVEGLDVRIMVPMTYGGPVLDIDRDFAEVTKEVCRENGREMVLEMVKSASGKPLVDGSPLLAQLGTDREVILSYEPRDDADFGICSSEVN